MRFSKIFKFLLPLLLASLVKARDPALDEVSERDTDDDGGQNGLPCAVSPDGTFKSSEGSLVDAQFTFRLEYGSGYDKHLLLEQMSENVGNAIISFIFPSCTPLFDLYDLHPDLDSVISGIDTNLVYASDGSCSASSENNSCEIFTGGYKVYLNDSTGRKLYVGAAAVKDTILGIVKKLMDSGDAAGMVVGIEGLQFGSEDAEPDGEPNEEIGGEDEEAAEELEEEILNEDLDLTDSEEEVVLQSTNGDPGEQKVPDKKAVTYVGWILLAVSTVVVALVGYQYHRRKKETYKRTPFCESEDNFEVENVLVDVEKSGSDDEFVEVVFDSSR